MVDGKTQWKKNKIGVNCTSWNNVNAECRKKVNAEIHAPGVMQTVYGAEKVQLRCSELHGAESTLTGDSRLCANGDRLLESKVHGREWGRKPWMADSGPIAGSMPRSVDCGGKKCKNLFFCRLRWWPLEGG